MKIEPQDQLPSPFFGNFICLIPNTNFSFVSVSKNASSFLKKIAVYNKTGDWISNPNDEMEQHNIIGYSSDKSEYLFPIESNLKGYDNLSIKKFAVWRDPVERMISTYELSVEKENLELIFGTWDFMKIVHLNNSINLSNLNIQNLQIRFMLMSILGDKLTITNPRM